MQIASCASNTGELGHILSLCGGLLQRGHRVLLGVRTRRRKRTIHTTLEHAKAVPGLEVIPLSLEGGFHPRWDLPDLLTLRKILRGQACDVLHTHRGKDHWLGLAAATVVGVPLPLVRTRHVVTPIATHLFNRWMFRRTDALVATCSPIRDALCRAAPGVDPMLLHGGIDNARFMPGPANDALRLELGIPDGAYVLAAVGEAARVKGFEYLIEATHRLFQSGRNVHLLLAMPPERKERPALVALAQRLNISCTLLGRRNDLPEVLRLADIGVISSIGSEGNSRVALEMMASGLPLVATAVGCLPDLMNRDLPPGLLVPARDSEALAAALSQLIDDPDLRGRMAVAARQAIEQHYTLDACAARVEALYEAVIARKQCGWPGPRG